MKASISMIILALCALAFSYQIASASRGGTLLVLALWGMAVTSLMIAWLLWPKRKTRS